MPLLRTFKSMDDGSISGIAMAGLTKKGSLKYIYPNLHIHSMQPALLTTHTKKK